MGSGFNKIKANLQNPTARLHMEKYCMTSAHMYAAIWVNANFLFSFCLLQQNKTVNTSHRSMSQLKQGVQMALDGSIPTLLKCLL